MKNSCKQNNIIRGVCLGVETVTGMKLLSEDRSIIPLPGAHSACVCAAECAVTCVLPSVAL